MSERETEMAKSRGVWGTQVAGVWAMEGLSQG